MFCGDFLCLQSLRCNAIIKENARGILEHAMHSIHLAARIPEECLNKTAGDKRNGIMGYIR